MVAILESLKKDWIRYRPYPSKCYLALLLWLLWVGLVHYAWLSKWYLLPVTGMLLSPNLAWAFRHVVREAYDQTLDGIKQFYELVAAQIGCGLALRSAIQETIDTMKRGNAICSALSGPLEQLEMEIEIGLFNDESLEPLADLSQVDVLIRGTEMVGICMRTGVGLESLLIQFSDMLSELLKYKRDFTNRLSQKRGEFQIMMFMPVLAIIGVRNIAPEYFIQLYETAKGQAFLLICTTVYSYACHLFYKHEDRMLREEGE